MAFSLAHDVRVGDHSVRLRCAGTGRPVLLLHDIGGSGASFAGLTSAIVAAGREAVAPDLPGFAQSDPIPGDLAELVAHLHALVTKVIDAPTAVVGRGFGGYLALSLAVRQPELYEGVLVEDPVLPPPAGGRSSSRMGAGMALSGAFTTVRRGRLLQNIGGFSRAKGLLESLAQQDQAWWDALERISARVGLLDLGGGRPDDRDRYNQLLGAIPGSSRTVVPPGRGQHDPGSAAEAAVIRFLS